jgi:hypothetical protein
VHVAPEAPCGGALHQVGALHARSNEDELRLAAPSHCNERGGQLLGVRTVVERSDRDDRREVGEAYQ